MFLQITEDHLNKAIAEPSEASLCNCCPINQALRVHHSGYISVHHNEVIVMDDTSLCIEYKVPPATKDFISEVDKFFNRPKYPKLVLPVTVELVECHEYI